MIKLLTGQPGNGKTSKLINIIRAALLEGRTVYTVGIPKLKLPVIELTRAQLMLWHERAPKPLEVILASQNQATTKSSKAFIDAALISGEVEPVFELKNIVEGALIVVDEAQKGFEPTGTKTPEHISYLSEHRHHGLDFVFATQYPFLIHQTVRALVTVHWHIRSTWKGRKIHEWPEWQERPQSQSALSLAASESYTIDPSTFSEYESASIHTVMKHKRPWYVYVVISSMVLVPVFAYFSFSRVYAKTQPKQIDSSLLGTTKNEPALKLDNHVAAPVVSTAPLEALKPQFQNVRMVSDQYDWSQIGACVQFKGRCTCYGEQAEKLVIPDSVCRTAVGGGWAGRNKAIMTAPAPPLTVIGVSGQSPDVDGFSVPPQSVGLGSRSSPNNS